MNFLRQVVGSAVKWLASLSIGRRRYCCVCQAHVFTFLPFIPKGIMPYRQPDFMVAMDVIGSDIRNFSCPRCESHDRERHLVLYLNATGFAEKIKKFRVLHLAPERHFSEYIQKQNPSKYVQGDLFPGNVNVQRVDLQNLPFPDGSFDLLIANHVLEHVANDKRALAEIWRILSTNGYAILQTPYSRVLTKTFEDSGIASDIARLQAYGQADHLRLYGRDIVEQFEFAGFADRSVEHEAVLGEFDPQKHGVNSREPLFLLQKI